MPDSLSESRKPRVLGWILGLLIAAGALGAGLWLGSAQRSQTAPTADAAATLTAMSFPTPDGGKQSLSQFHGQLLVVNFWATWCPPCREEIPGLIRIQTQFGPKGVQVVGIAIDSVEKTREYAAEIGINYALLMGGMETLDLVRSLGNKAGALPFTVIVDRRGKIAATHLGLMSEQQLAGAIASAAN